MIDWPTLINGVVRYVPEVVLVVIFMVYQERQQDRRDKADAERTRHRITSDEKRDAVWQALLRDEREQRKEDSSRSEHMSDLIQTKANATYDLLKLHDEWEREAQKLRRNLDRRQGE